MDKPRTPNPLLQPADEVLKSAIYLERDPNFQIIATWISACYAAAVHTMPAVKEEIELRWAQGRCQTLLLINKALTQGREELAARQATLEKNKLPRNV